MRGHPFFRMSWKMDGMLDEMEKNEINEMNEMNEMNDKCFGIREVVDMWYDSENVDIDGSDILELDKMMRDGMDRVRWRRDVGWIAERSLDEDNWE